MPILGAGNFEYDMNDTVTWGRWWWGLSTVVYGAATVPVPIRYGNLFILLF